MILDRDDDDDDATMTISRHSQLKTLWNLSQFGTLKN